MLLPVVLYVGVVRNDNVRIAAHHGGLSPRQLARAITAMRDNDADPLAAIASSINVSRGYFARAFRVSMGMTPHRWRSRDRVERAMALLRDPGASIADVAAACGFADQSHLTRLFVRHLGLGPAAWRRQPP